MSVSQTADVASLIGDLKELYSGQRMNDMTYTNNPFFAAVKKDTNDGGKSYPIPILNQAGQGTSASFSIAQGATTAPQVNEFFVTQKTIYKTANLSRQLFLNADSNIKAFMKSSSLVLDSAFKALTNDVAIQLFRDGTGTIGTIASGGITSGVITLTSPLDGFNFNIGQVLQAASSGTLRAALGYVIAVSRTGSTGQVTVSTSQNGSAASPASWAAGDTLCLYGTQNAAFSGLAAWLPYTAPTSSDPTFFGVPRYTDPTNLAGVRTDGTSGSVTEAFRSTALLIDAQGGNPDHIFTNYDTYTQLEQEMYGKAEYDNLMIDNNIRFRGIKVRGPAGDMLVVPDRSCPKQFSYMLQMDTWELRSSDPMPHIQNFYGNGPMLVQSAQDGFEFRMSGYGQLCCMAPGWNAVVKTAV